MNKKVPYFRFRLYITGDSPNSTLAVCNLRALCQEHLQGQHEIEIVDVLLEPHRALADGVLLTPTLIKLTPVPLRQIIGNLSERQPVMLALHIGVKP